MCPVIRHEKSQHAKEGNSLVWCHCCEPIITFPSNLQIITWHKRAEGVVCTQVNLVALDVTVVVKAIKTHLGCVSFGLKSVLLDLQIKFGKANFITVFGLPRLYRYLSISIAQ